MSIRVEGLSKFENLVKGLAKAGASKANRQAVASATHTMLNVVRREVPVDKGELKNAQISKVKNRGTSAWGKVGADAKKLKTDAAAEGRPTNIDWLVNFGHIALDGNFIPPNAYLYRAAAIIAVVALEVYQRRLREQIAAEIAKGGA